MESLHILPGKGIGGYFSLEMSLLKALKKLRTFSTRLPCINVIEEVNSKRIIIDIPENRLKLVFDEDYQKLLIIEINCAENTFPKLPIMFQSQQFTNYNEIIEFLDSAYKVLHENSSIEQYKGLSVLKHENQLLKIFIHKGENLFDHNFKVKIFQVKLNEKKIVIHNITEKIQDLNLKILPEEAIELLGVPDYVRYKNSETSSDFFYSYVGDGIDLLFAGKDHRLGKIIMHTNMIEDVYFNEYERCNFVIFANQGEITPKTKFEEISKTIGQEPMEAGVRRHGFGYSLTHYYKFGDICFEVLHTGYVASVILSF